MAITAQDVLAIAPELSAVPTATFTSYIADSAIAYDLSAYPDDGTRDYIQKNLVAFMMVDQGVSGPNGSGMRGAVINERVGELSRGFATLGTATAGDSDLENELKRNRFGMAVLRYRQRNAVRVATAPTCFFPGPHGALGPGWWP